MTMELSLFQSCPQLRSPQARLIFLPPSFADYNILTPISQCIKILLHIQDLLQIPFLHKAILIASPASLDLAFLSSLQH